MATALQFFGSNVNAYTEDEVDIIGLANDEVDPDKYVILSRYDDPSADDQPRREMVGIETSSSDYEVAAAVASIKLGRKSIQIDIVDDKQDEVGVPTIIVDYQIDDSAFDKLRSYVEALVKDTDIVLLNQ